MFLLLSNGCSHSQTFFFHSCLSASSMFAVLFCVCSVDAFPAVNIQQINRQVMMGQATGGDKQWASDDGTSKQWRTQWRWGKYWGKQQTRSMPPPVHSKQPTGAVEATRAGASSSSAAERSPRVEGATDGSTMISQCVLIYQTNNRCLLAPCTCPSLAPRTCPHHWLCAARSERPPH